jgi:MFS family permease
MSDLLPGRAVARPIDHADHSRMALFALCAAQFLVVLDIAIVNVALPSISTSLHVSGASLAWVVNAYVLTLAGLLLVGGRLADQLGRRRVFLAGLGIFGIASLGCGLATASAVLVAARAVQGIGAALAAPSALALIADIFPAGRERTRVLGVWG